MANDFGKNLKIMRKLNNITQSEMARKVNASRSCISNYESGKRQPDAETINFIADFFDVSIDYLMGRSSVKLSVKNEKELEELQNLNRKANAIKILDLNNASLSTRCVILEFYAYLREKELKQKDLIESF